MPTRLALATVAVVTLAACTTTTPEQRIARDQQMCVGYGFAQGTDAFAQCMMELDLDRRAAQRDRLNRISYPTSFVIYRVAD
jgi:hypothetical protein